MNERSSRSHSVFTLKVSGSNPLTGENCEGALNLVDLAGSERLNSSGAGSNQARMKETISINSSLSALKDVIEKLGQGETKHVPYRNSKLTYLLQTSLSGGCRRFEPGEQPADYCPALQARAKPSCCATCHPSPHTPQNRCAACASPSLSTIRRWAQRSGTWARGVLRRDNKSEEGCGGSARAVVVSSRARRFPLRYRVTMTIDHAGATPTLGGPSREDGWWHIIRHTHRITMHLIAAATSRAARRAAVKLVDHHGCRLSKSRSLSRLARHQLVPRICGPLALTPGSIWSISKRAFATEQEPVGKGKEKEVLAEPQAVGHLTSVTGARADVPVPSGRSRDFRPSGRAGTERITLYYPKRPNNPSSPVLSISRLGNRRRAIRASDRDPGCGRLQ